METIKTKPEFAALSNRGRLGNYLKSWPSYAEYLASDYEGYTTIRSKTPASPHFISCVDPGGVRNALDGLLAKGASESDLYIQQVPHPGSARRIQFEVMQDDRLYLALHYEFETTEALRGIRDRGLYATGARAARIMRDYLYEDSFETVQEIWGEYPRSVIEATEFSLPCGAFNQRLVVWETRHF